MTRNTPIRTAVLVGATALALLTSACSDGGSDDSGKPSPGASSANSPGSKAASGTPKPDALKGPAWTGSPLPGLADKPVWSIKRGSGYGDSNGWSSHLDTLQVVGNTIVVDHLNADTSKSGSGSPQSVPHRVEFRDAATGDVLATVHANGDLTVETWQGKPALVVRERKTIPASGLTPERKVRVVTAYDERGQKLGSVELSLDDQKFEENVEDGWVLRVGERAEDQRNLWARPVDQPDFGPPALTCKAGSSGCEIGISPDFGHEDSFALGTAFLTEHDEAADVDHLVAYDAKTGQRRWSSATIQPPQGVPTLEQIRDKGRRAKLLGTVGDKLLIGWPTYAQTGLLDPDEMVLALHDPVTGAVTTPGTGPVVDPDKLRVTRSPDGKLLFVASGSGSDARSQAWELATGRILWRQGEGERPAVVASVVNGAAYADVSGSLDDNGRDAGETVVLDALTKDVILPKGPKGDGVPLVAANGCAVVADEKGIWAFGPKPVG